MEGSPTLTGLLRTSGELLHAVWTLQQRLAGPEFSQYQRLVASYPEVRGQPAAWGGSTTRAACAARRLPATRLSAGPRSNTAPSPPAPQFCAKLQRRFLEHPVTEMKLDKVGGARRRAASSPGGRPPAPPRGGLGLTRARPFPAPRAAARRAGGARRVQLRRARPGGAAAAGVRPA
jgi:hypothetical protein